MNKIKVKNPLAILHGDEMAQIAFDKIIEVFVKKYLDINLTELDLSAKNRLKTNGKIVLEAIDETKKCKVAIKNAGITVNKSQLEEFINQLSNEGVTINKASLDKLATKSPNGTIRKGIGGNITREDIAFSNIKKILPNWIGKKIEVFTMNSGGVKDSYSTLSSTDTDVIVEFVSDNNSQELHKRKLSKNDPVMLMTCDIKQVSDWTHELFEKAIKENKHVYLALKDTVMPGYDGVIRQKIEYIFNENFKEKFEKNNLEYHYGLIDSQAAQIVTSPPSGDIIWAVPDSSSGDKMNKLVNRLKNEGIKTGKTDISVSRMSAGGGDQYGSFNISAPSEGKIQIKINNEIAHSRKVSKGDAILLMSNETDAIESWVKQSFNHACENNEELYFGIDPTNTAYDLAFEKQIQSVKNEHISSGKTPPPIMMMKPDEQLQKMIVDTPKKGRFACMNLDGDIFSDITAALGGSLATASSVIEGENSVMLFEAPHGTAPDLYETYLKSEGKEAYFNSSALIYAVANSLKTISVNENNTQLAEYAKKLKSALIQTVDEGKITGDLKGKTKNPKSEKILDMNQFIDAVDNNIIN